MRVSYDVAVVGLGIMGAAALWRLSTAGVSVIGFDKNSPTHEFGSSYGASRIFRQAYWEGEKYLPLLKHANTLWNELQATTDKILLHRTGGIFIGPQSTGVVAGSARTARAGGIEHEIWTAGEIRKRLPVFTVEDDMQAIYEPSSYAIAAQDAKLQMVEAAIVNGAIAIHGQGIKSIISKKDTFIIETESMGSIEVSSVVVTIGPWISGFTPKEISKNVKPHRVPIYWFQPRYDMSESFSRERFPVFLYERPSGDLLYGVPSISTCESGVKIGFHNRQHTPSNPENISSTVAPQFMRQIENAVRDILPGLVPNPICARTCFYTMSKDEAFLIGTSIDNPNMHYASACSGHGFKFATAVGDVLSNLVLRKDNSDLISGFSSERFDG